MKKNFVVIDFFPEVSNIGETEESRLKDFFLKHLATEYRSIAAALSSTISREYVEIDRENQQMKFDISCVYTTINGPMYDIYEYKFDETSEDLQILLITKTPIRYANY
jgi:hypothetical protein